PLGAPASDGPDAAQGLQSTTSTALPIRRAILCFGAGHYRGLQYGSRGFLTAAPDDCPRGPFSTDSRFASHPCLPSVATLAGQSPGRAWSGADPLALSGSPPRTRYLLVSVYSSEMICGERSGVN